MNKLELRERVIILRKKGKTYSEIQREVKVLIPKSTLSSWCRKIILPYWYRKKIAAINNINIVKAQNIAQLQNKKKRDGFLKKIRTEANIVLKRFNQEGLKIALAMLYLGEGAKWKGHSGLLLGSSGPELVLLYILLLKKCYNIGTDQLKCRISYRSDQDIKELEKYWSGITGIPLKNFYKTKPDPRTKGKKTQKVDYKGVCVITCAGAKIQIELEELAKLLLKNLRARSSVGRARAWHARGSGVRDPSGPHDGKDCHS